MGSELDSERQLRDTFSRDQNVTRLEIPMYNEMLVCTLNGSTHVPEQAKAGRAVRRKAAAGIIALRACDGSFPNPPAPPFTG